MPGVNSDCYVLMISDEKEHFDERITKTKHFHHYNNGHWLITHNKTTNVF